MLLRDLSLANKQCSKLGGCPVVDIYAMDFFKYHESKWNYGFMKLEIPSPNRLFEAI